MAAIPYICSGGFIVLLLVGFVILKYFTRRTLLVPIESDEDPLAVDPESMKELVTGFRGRLRRKGITALVLVLVLGCMLTAAAGFIGPQIVAALQPTPTPTNTPTPTPTPTNTPTPTPTITPGPVYTPTLGLGTQTP